MSVAVTGAYKDLFDTRQIQWFTTFERQDTPYWSQYCNVKPSTTRQNDSARFSGLGVVRTKFEGGTIFYDAPVQGARRRTVHQTFALGYRVTMEAEMDGQFDLLRRQPRDLARAIKEHRENLAIGLIDDAYDGLTHTGLDGRPLIDTAHPLLKPVVAGSTSSNELSPGIPFSTEGVEAALTNLHTSVSDEGRQMGYSMSGGKKWVFHHPSLEHQVATVLETDKRPDTDFNNINTAATSRTGIQGLSLPHQLDVDSWMLVIDKSAMGDDYCLQWNERMGNWIDNSIDAQTKDRLYDSGYRASVEVVGNRGLGFVGSQV